MGGCAENIVRAAFLDNAAGIHDGDAAADISDKAEIVADHQDGRSPLGAKIAHQLDDLACTVTSSAVVGSSAIRRSGPHASAIAIITR